jgi:hypothetical protein
MAPDIIKLQRQQEAIMLNIETATTQELIDEIKKRSANAHNAKFATDFAIMLRCHSELLQRQHAQEAEAR